MTQSGLRLRHVHIPGRISYATSIAVQSAILAQYFANRRRHQPLTSTSTSTSSLTTGTGTGTDTDTGAGTGTSPLPALLTFTTHPTYTVGRRHLESNPLSDSQIAYLTRNNTAASFQASPRGGLLTYHGPGQLTAYPLIDLRVHKLGARQYVRLLEDVVINTCKKLGVPNVGVSCTDPGVWIVDNDNNGHNTSTSTSTSTSTTNTNRKICALGVQVTRGVSSHGIGLNVFDEPIQPSESFGIPTNNGGGGGDNETRQRYSFDQDDYYTETVDPRTMGYLSWGFGRIVGCGLEGKATTWLSRERARAAAAAAAAAAGGGTGVDANADADGAVDMDVLRGKGWHMSHVAGVLAECLREGLNSTGKVVIDPTVQTDVVSLHRQSTAGTGTEEQDLEQNELLAQILP